MWRSNHENNKLIFLTLLLTGANTVWSGQINLCVEDAIENRPISNMFVECFDDNWNNYRPGSMTNGTTDFNGCISLTYPNKPTSWWKCWKWWDYCTSKNPDIVCKVLGSCYQPKNSEIKKNHPQHIIADFGTVSVLFNEDHCKGFNNVNGCGPSYFSDELRAFLDRVSGFGLQCNAHDMCYQNCVKPRLQCEEEFLNGMYSVCCVNCPLCRFMAGMFHFAAYNFGACYEHRDHCTQEEQDTCIL